MITKIEMGLPESNRNPEWNNNPWRSYERNAAAGNSASGIKRGW